MNNRNISRWSRWFPFLEQHISSKLGRNVFYVYASLDLLIPKKAQIWVGKYTGIMVKGKGSHDTETHGVISLTVTDTSFRNILRRKRWRRNNIIMSFEYLFFLSIIIIYTPKILLLRGATYIWPVSLGIKCCRHHRPHKGAPCDGTHRDRNCKESFAISHHYHHHVSSSTTTIRFFDDINHIDKRTKATQSSLSSSNHQTFVYFITSYTPSSIEYCCRIAQKVQTNIQTHKQKHKDEPRHIKIFISVTTFPGSDHGILQLDGNGSIFVVVVIIVVVDTIRY